MKKINKLEYGKYLKSARWDNLRKFMYNRAGYRCQLCGEKKERLNVHHNSYDNIGNESEKDLIVLCESCHCWHHIDEGEKAVILAALQLNGKPEVDAMYTSDRIQRNERLVYYPKKMKEQYYYVNYTERVVEEKEYVDDNLDRNNLNHDNCFIYNEEGRLYADSKLSKYGNYKKKEEY